MKGPAYYFKLGLTLFAFAFCMSMGNVLIRDTADAMLIPTFGAEFIPQAKMTGQAVVLALAALLAIFSFVVRPRTILMTLLVGVTLAPGVFGAFLLADETQTWALHAYCLLKVLVGTLGWFLPFALLNESFPLRKSGRCYPFFIVTIALAGQLALMLMGGVIAPYAVYGRYEAWEPLLLGGLLGLVTLFFGWLFARLAAQHDPEGKNDEIGAGWGFILALGGIGLVSQVVNKLVQMTWKMDLRSLYSTGTEYLDFIGSYSIFVGIAAILALPLLLLPTVLLWRRPSKSWGPLQLVVWILGALLLAPFLILQVFSSGTGLEGQVFVGTAHELLTGTFLGFQLLLLKEVGLTALPAARRFRAKVVTDLLILSWVPSGALHVLLFLGYGPEVPLWPLLLLPLLGLLCIMVSWKKMSRLNDQVEVTTMEKSASPEEKKKETTLALLAHLSTFACYIFPFGGIIAALILWRANKDDMPYAAAEARESLNFQLTCLLYLALSIALCFLLIGFPLLLALTVFSFVMPIIGAIRASKGTAYRYPLCLRMV